MTDSKDVNVNAPVVVVGKGLPRADKEITAVEVPPDAKINAAGEIVTREDLQSGFKADGGKPRMDLVPPYAMTKLVEHFFSEGRMRYATATPQSLQQEILVQSFAFMAGGGLENIMLVAAAAAVWLELEREVAYDDWNLLPPVATLELGDLYGIGARKYDDRNWEKGMSWGRVIAAMLRHLFKFMAGEECDQVDGQHHLVSVYWCSTVLMEYVLTGTGKDDRTGLRIQQ